MSLVSPATVCERRWDRHLAMFLVVGCVLVLLLVLRLGVVKVYRTKEMQPRKPRRTLRKVLRWVLALVMGWMRLGTEPYWVLALVMG